MSGAASQKENDGHDEEADDANNLGRGKPELDLAVKPYGEAIAGYDDDHDDCDPHHVGYRVFPIVYYECCGSYLGGYSDGQDIPVYSAERKA